MNRKNLKIRMFIEALRQQKLNVVVTAIILGLQLVIVSFSLWDYARRLNEGAEAYTYKLLEVQPMLALVPSVVLAVMIYQQFSWMNKRSESDFYHSIPIKRIWLLLVNVGAAIALCFALFWGFALLANVVFPIVSGGKVSFEQRHIFRYFIEALIMGLMISGAVMIGRGLAGKTGPAGLLALIVLYGPRTIFWAIKMIMEDMLPFVALKGGVLWEHKYNLMFFVGLGDDGYGSIFYSLVLCLIYWVVAAILFVKRKSEIAEKIAANAKIQLFVRLFIAFCISIFPNALMISRVIGENDDEVNVVIFTMYILAFAAYFLYELISTRKISSMVKAAPGLLILIGIDIAMIAGCSLYINHCKNVEINQDNIESISFEYVDDFYSSDYKAINEAYVGKPIKSEKLNKVFVERLREAKNRNYLGFVELVYTVKTTGGTYYRKIDLSLRELLSIIKESDIALELKFEDFVELKDVDAYRTTVGEYNMYVDFYEKASGMSEREFVDWYIDCIVDGNMSYVDLVLNNKRHTTVYIPREADRSYYSGRYGD